MIWLKAFIAAFLATLIFHQGLFGLFYLADILPKAPYNMTPTGPLGVPSVLSLALWGGLWGCRCGHWYDAERASAIG